MNKPAFIIFIILSFPFALAWSLIYGLIIGIIGSTVDVYETIRDKVYQDIRGALKYPGWRTEVYERLHLKAAEDSRGRIPEEARRAVEKGKIKPPSIIGSIILHTCVFILYYPFLLIWGIATGPIRAFFEYYKWGYKTWTGHSIYRGGMY